MGRIFLLVFLAAIALVDARVRERLVPYAQGALDPVHEWSTRSTVSEIARALEAEAARGGRLPTADSLPGYLASHRAGFRPDRDPWGTPYYLREEFYALRVGSAGRDLTAGTGDDILSGVLDVAP